VVVLYAGAGAVFVAASFLFPSPSWLLPLEIGFLIGLVPFMAHTFLSAVGLTFRWLGADAERWTSEELQKLPSRSWAVFHDIPLEYANVDHVAVGPGRIYAIETKWSSGDLEGRAVKRLAGQAAHRAQSLQRTLADAGIRREVVPLLVLWGPAAYRRFGEKPAKVGPTRIVAGHASKDWLDRMQSAAAVGDIDHPARQALRQLIDDYDAKQAETITPAGASATP
jgi:hypothetical protein